MAPQNQSEKEKSGNGRGRGKGKGKGKGRGQSSGQGAQTSKKKPAQVVVTPGTGSINPMLLQNANIENNLNLEPQQNVSTASISLKEVASIQSAQLQQIPLQRSGNPTELENRNQNLDEDNSLISSAPVPSTPAVVPHVPSTPAIVPTSRYPATKRRRIEREQETGHVRLDQTLLKRVVESGQNLPLEMQEKIAACLLSDKFSVPMAVAEFRTPDVFVSKKLVAKAVNAMTRKKRIEKLVEARAAAAAAALARDGSLENYNESQDEQNEGFLARRSPGLESVALWTEDAVNNLLLLKDNEFMQNIESVVTVSVVADVSVAGFVSRLEKAASMDSIQSMGKSIAQMRSSTAVAEVQEKMKKYVAVAIAIGDLDRNKKQKQLILNSLKKIGRKRTIANLQSNLKLLMERFTSRILFCLPFIDGFELENLASLSPESLDLLTRGSDFCSVSRNLLLKFVDEGRLLDELFQ